VGCLLTLPGPTLANMEGLKRQSAENMEYVRSLLRQKQPGFSAALELALVLAELGMAADRNAAPCLHPNRTARRRYRDGAVTRTMPGSLVQPGM
jgi:hypothetical protein